MKRLTKTHGQITVNNKTRLVITSKKDFKNNKHNIYTSNVLEDVKI
jgi:hypothetical protein